MNVAIRFTREGAKLPYQANPGDAGFDVYSVDATVLLPHSHQLVKTGIQMALPDGIECQVRPRSGLALKMGITVLNSPGTIDSGYRGEVGVILHNTSGIEINLPAGERVAQFVFAPYLTPALEVVNELPESARGEGGFGSSGRS